MVSVRLGTVWLKDKEYAKNFKYDDSKLLLSVSMLIFSWYPSPLALPQSRPMLSRVYATVGSPSVCLSLRLSQHSAAVRRWGGFAAVGLAGKRSIDCCTAGA